MKRILAILLVLLLSGLCLTACSKVDDGAGSAESVESVDIVGSWKSTKGGQVGDFVFNVGGGGKVTLDEGFAEITWSTEGNTLTVHVGEAALLVDAPYEIEGDQLTVTYNEITQVFTKG